MQPMPKTIPFQLLEIPLDRRSGGATCTQIGVCDKLATEEILAQAISLKLEHLIQRQNHGYDRELAVAKLMMSSADTFMNFPVSSILSPQEASAAKDKEVTIFAAQCYTRSEKTRIMQKLNVELAWRFNEGLVNEVCLIADELVSNAAIHGPPKRPGVLEQVKPGEGVAVSTALHPASLRVATDGERIVICCTDLYGTLNVAELLERLRRTFSFGIASMMNFGPGGAGIGFYNIFRPAVGCYVAVVPGKRTVVCSSILIRGSASQRENSLKNLHLIAKGEL